MCYVVYKLYQNVHTLQLKSRISDLTQLQQRANNLKSTLVYASMDGCAQVIDTFCDALTTHISAFFTQV
jgi:hypothetical protein